MKYYNPEVIERIGYDFYADIAERIVDKKKERLDTRATRKSVEMAKDKNCKNRARSNKDKLGGY